jgi:hypothetical protein
MGPVTMPMNRALTTPGAPSGPATDPHAGMDMGRSGGNEAPRASGVPAPASDPAASGANMGGMRMAGCCCGCCGGGQAAGRAQGGMCGGGAARADQDHTQDPLLHDPMWNEKAPQGQPRQSEPR